MKTSQLNMQFPGEGEVVLILAHDDAEFLVGTVCVRRRGPVAEFARLFVVESHRKLGVGRALLTHANAAAMKAGCFALSASVNAKNLEARRFYQKLGFVTGFDFGDGDLLVTRPVVPALNPPSPVDVAAEVERVLADFEAKQRGIPQAHMAAELVAEIRAVIREKGGV